MEMAEVVTDEVETLFAASTIKGAIYFHPPRDQALREVVLAHDHPKSGGTSLDRVGEGRLPRARRAIEDNDATGSSVHRPARMPARACSSTTQDRNGEARPEAQTESGMASFARGTTPLSARLIAAPACSRRAIAAFADVPRASGQNGGSGSVASTAGFRKKRFEVSECEAYRVVR